MQYEFNLKRQWFSRERLKDIKHWVDYLGENAYAHAAIFQKETLHGNGYLVSLSQSDGVAAAEAVYESLGSPEYLIYVNKIYEDKVWFIFAFEGVLYGDYLVNVESFEKKAQQGGILKIIQEIERFKNKDITVKVYCEDAIYEEHSNSLLFFSGLLSLPVSFQVELIKEAVSLSELATEDFALAPVHSLNYPKDWKKRGYIAGGLAVFIAINALLTIEFKEEAPKVDPRALEPIVIDKYKELKRYLTEDGQGIKQRFAFIVQEIIASNKIEGWELTRYDAEGDINSFYMKRTFGDATNINAAFPDSVFYKEFTPGGVKVGRKIPSYPILNPPVRANHSKEISWLSDAIEWVWRDVEVKSGVAIKEELNVPHIISNHEVVFSSLFYQDLDSLSSLFVGRSAGFKKLTFTVNHDSNEIEGSFEFQVIGVKERL